MKLFAFAIYTCGMLAYLGLMLMESGVGYGAQQALRAIPPTAQALPDTILSRRASELGGNHRYGFAELCFFGCSGSVRVICSFSGSRVRDGRHRHRSTRRKRAAEPPRGRDDWLGLIVMVKT